MKTDRRYGSKRWRSTAKAAVVRDLYQCYVPSCEETGNVADHIVAVYDGMPDSEFFDMANLRASCRRHNTARGVAARLERETAGIAMVQRRSRYSYGPRFFSGAAANERPLANLSPFRRSPALFGDFTRKLTE